VLLSPLAMIDKPISIASGTDKTCRQRFVCADNLPYSIKSASRWHAAEKRTAVIKHDTIVRRLHSDCADAVDFCRRALQPICRGHSSPHRKMRNEWTPGPFISPEAHYQLAGKCPIIGSPPEKSPPGRQFTGKNPPRPNFYR